MVGGGGAGSVESERLWWEGGRKRGEEHSELC